MLNYSNISEQINIVIKFCNPWKKDGERNTGLHRMWYREFSILRKIVALVTVRERICGSSLMRKSVRGNCEWTQGFSRNSNHSFLVLTQSKLLLLADCASCLSEYKDSFNNLLDKNNLYIFLLQIITLD